MLFAQIIAFVLVMVAFEAYDPKSPSIPLGDSLLICLSFLMLVWLATSLNVRILTRRIKGPFATPNPQARVRRMSAILHGGGVLALIAMFTASDIKAHLNQVPLLAASQTLAGLCALALFFIVLGIVWYGVYPLERQVLYQPLSRLSYVRSQARFVAPVAFPWLLVTALQDLTRLVWPSAHAWLNSETGDLVFLAMFMLILSLMFPALVRYWWGCRPWPVGRVRRISDEVLDRARVSVRGILDWPIMDGRIITAGILGVFPISRFLLITPALAENMSDDELAAVVAHEAGHVRHRHMLQYLLFFLGFFVLSYFLAGPLSLALGSFLYLVAGSAWGVELITSPDKSAALDLFMALPLVFLMILYLRFVMGYFMRHFERQADLYALRLTGTSLHLASALEKVASLSGNIREVPSWHHFSVAQRVEHLLNAQADKRLIRAESRKITRGFLVYTLCMGLLITTSLGLGYSEIASGLEKNITLRVLEQKLAGQNLTPVMAMELGILRFEAGEEARGISDLERVLSTKPGDPELLNTLAWFLVTARDKGLRQPRRALRMAEKAVTRSPKPHIWDTYAEALYVNRDYARAVAAARSALRAGPKRRLQYYKDQLKRFENALAAR